jgi:hypothetical protein
MCVGTTETLSIIAGSASLTTVLNFLVAQWNTRKTADRDKAHQVLLVVEHLENYAFGCAGHAFGNYNVLQEKVPGALLSQPPAFPPYSDLIRWTALEVGHATAARRLPHDVELAIAASAAGFQKGSIDGFSTAFYWTLQLGNEAVGQATFLRGYTGLGPLVLEGRRWDFPLFLRGEMEKLDLRKAQIADKVADNALATGA